MRVQPALPGQSIRVHCNPDNLLLIENAAGNVIIRAVQDNFSPRQKAFFIRHLAAEGYIPDRFEHLYEPGCDAASSIRWIIDPNCLRPSIKPRPRRRTHRQSDTFIMGSLLSVFLLWLILMLLAFLGVL